LFIVTLILILHDFEHLVPLIMKPRATEKNDRPEIFWEFTRSICPQCKQVIDAHILMRENKVFMRKRCPDHGVFEALVFGDAKLYREIAPYNKPGTIPLTFATEVKDGCPLDCGLCPDHQQHTCLALIEVNSACNMDCPLCFANSGTHLVKDGWELTFEQVEFMIDRFIEAEGNPEVLQFSGGEPTIHPLILDFIKLAKDKGIRHVMLNTNGIRIANDDDFLHDLAKLKPNIYLQFDGFDENTNLAIRGRKDLLPIKLRALERMQREDLLVVLVPAIERGINEHEIGEIVKFGIKHPAVFGIHFQTAFRAQRHIPADPLTRMTIPDILHSMEEQSDGLLKLSDFVPVPCCMPVCNFVTYVLLFGDQVIPIPRVLEVDQYLDYIKNRTLPGLNEDILHSLEQLWSSSATIGTIKTALNIRKAINGKGINGKKKGLEIDGCTACQSHYPLSKHSSRDLARHIFMISIRDFMDPWTFNVKNVMKCCVEFLVPDGRMIPFCSYNSVGYREQVTAGLMKSKQAEPIKVIQP